MNFTGNFRWNASSLQHNASSVLEQRKRHSFPFRSFIIVWLYTFRSLTFSSPPPHTFFSISFCISQSSSVSVCVFQPCKWHYDGKIWSLSIFSMLILFSKIAQFKDKTRCSKFPLCHFFRYICVCIFILVLFSIQIVYCVISWQSRWRQLSTLICTATEKEFISWAHTQTKQARQLMKIRIE